MKRSLLFLMCCACFALASCSKDDPGKETGPAFPDPNFRKVLVEEYGFVETDGDIDPKVDKNKAQFPAITQLYLGERNISSLKGIEYFTELEVLHCGRNHLAILDLTRNPNLRQLYCDNNRLTKLDLTKNAALEYLGCIWNQLYTLDVSNNTSLTELWCSSNHLSALDVSTNTELNNLYCDNNQILALDLSNNTRLTNLVCHGNQLSQLDLTENTRLNWLWCFDNQLSELNISPLRRLDIDRFRCGSQRPDRELTLLLTVQQTIMWYNVKDFVNNERVKTVVTN